MQTFDELAPADVNYVVQQPRSYLHFQVVNCQWLQVQVQYGGN